MQGKAIRFAPGRELEPASWFWRMWTEGNEIYALTRNSGEVLKVSVHASGQIHYRLGPKHKQNFAPLMQLGSSHWNHALEIRFLISETANVPPPQRDSLKNKSAYLIPTPADHFLVLNLIITAAGTSNSPLPAQFSGAQILWQASLPDGRLAVLICRVLKLDDENRNKIAYYRQTLRPTATFSGAPREAYVEIHHLHWSTGGNVILVVPMGNEALRSEQEVTQSRAAIEPLKFPYRSPQSMTEIFAPNGARVATLELDEVDEQIKIIKNQPSTHELGTLKMRLDVSNLIAGSEFIASPCRLVCIPAIAGANPREWTYTIYPQFDGFSLLAKLMPMSCSLQNRNLTTPSSQFSDEEELVINIPNKTLNLRATIDAPATSAKVIGRFTLRDRR